ncbi:MAG: hypothetical protein IT581_14045 [Verrucomicrobiales bacterium]|nr:hypothetical protein [Verrucomicrobiales bacterium]
MKIAFRQADHYSRYNEWVQLAVTLFRAIGIYGTKFKVDGDSGVQKVNRVKRWEKENVSALHDLHRDIWRDYIVHSNAVVASWPGRDGTLMRPLVLAPWKVSYSNKFGREQLEYQHGLSAEEVKAMPAEWQPAFHGGVVRLHEVPGAKFWVITGQRFGAGLDTPSMMSVFHGCRTAEALAAADGSLAEAARRVRIQHKLGYEIKTGPNAGARMNHADQARKAAVRKDFEGATGLKEFADNFDHEVIFTALDPKYFDQKRLDSVERRLFTWSAPIGQMLMARGGIAPFLMTLLRVKIEGMQADIGRKFASIVNEGMSPPGEFKVRYNPRILKDDRLAAETMKFALTSGMASLRTARGEAGLDDDEERSIKAEESKQPDHEKLPVFDPAHGKSPGLSTKGGRPKADGSQAE